MMVLPGITGLLFAWIACLGIPLGAADLPLVRIGIVIDGPWDRTDAIRVAFEPAREHRGRPRVAAAGVRRAPDRPEHVRPDRRTFAQLLSGGGMWESMALAIMFGLLFATGLTLGVVPVLYSVLFRVSYKDSGV